MPPGRCRIRIEARDLGRHLGRRPVPGRFAVGQAHRAAALIDDDATEISVSVVALAECTHVLRTQYEVKAPDIVDALIGFIQRANVRVLEVRTDVVVEAFVRARSMPGRPIPDALIVAGSIATGASPLVTFESDQRRYAIDVANRSPLSRSD